MSRKNRFRVIRESLVSYAELLRNREQLGICLDYSSKESVPRDLAALRNEFYSAESLEKKKEILAAIENMTGTVAVDLRLDLNASNVTEMSR